MLKTILFPLKIKWLLAGFILLFISCNQLESPFQYEEKVFSDEEFSHFFPALPKLEKDNEIFIIDGHQYNNYEFYPIVSIQGILAKEKSQIYINVNSASNIWIDDLEEWYKISINRDFYTDPKGLISHFLDKLSEKKYIICDSASVNLAMSLSGILNYLVFDQSQSGLADALALTQAVDVRGKNHDWLMGQYGSQFNNSLLMIQSNMEMGGRDLAIAHSALQYFDENSTKLPDFLLPNSPVVGKLPENLESEILSSLSQNESVFLEIDDAFNLSLLSTARAREISQHQRTYPEPDSAKHYICFISTGGHDFGHLISGLISNNLHYASSSRGKVNMAWQVSPSALDLSSTVLKYYYDKVSLDSNRDVFICAASGGGLFFPSRHNNLENHISKLEKSLELSSLSIVAIEDLVNDITQTDIYDSYTSLDEVDAVFYMNYLEKDKHNGEIFWSNNKPVITARYNISQEEDEGVVLSSLSELKVKNYSPKGYSLVILNHDYRTVSLAEDLMDNLNPKKFVSVPPDVFIKLINENIEH